MASYSRSSGEAEFGDWLGEQNEPIVVRKRKRSSTGEKDFLKVVKDSSRPSRPVKAKRPTSKQLADYDWEKRVERAFNADWIMAGVAVVALLVLGLVWGVL